MSHHRALASGATAKLHAPRTISGYDVCPASRLEQAHERAVAVEKSVQSGVFGRDDTIRRCIATVIAGGHGLLEGDPGQSKSRLVESLFQALNFQTNKVGFTNDLQPRDLWDKVVHDRDSGELIITDGPIFCEGLMADEFNNASGRTQRALLQAMQGRVVFRGEDPAPLPEWFTVFAAENPPDVAEGTYPLSKAIKDRFMMVEFFGNIDRDASKRVGRLGRQESQKVSVEPVLSRYEDEATGVIRHEITDIQSVADDIVYAHTPIEEFVQDLIAKLRPDNYEKGSDHFVPQTFSKGMNGERPVMLLPRMAKAFALMEGSKAVEFEHIQAVAPYALGAHLTHKGSRADMAADEAIAKAFLETKNEFQP